MADNIEGSLYEVLGLDDFESDARVISLAYRRLARQYHPDRNSTKPQSEQDAAAERFQEVSHANDILGDADEKEAYDEELHGNTYGFDSDDESSEASDPLASFFEFGQRRSYVSPTRPEFEQRQTQNPFADIFESLYGRSRYQPSGHGFYNTRFTSSSFENMQERVRAEQARMRAQEAQNARLEQDARDQLPVSVFNFVRGEVQNNRFRWAYATRISNTLSSLLRRDDCQQMIRGQAVLLTLVELTDDALGYLLSPHAVQAITDGVFNFNELSAIDSDRLRYILSFEGIQVMQESLLSIDDLSGFSPEILACVMTPTYLQALRQIVQQEGNVFYNQSYASSQEGSNPYVDHVLNRINYHYCFERVGCKADELEITAGYNFNYIEAHRAAGTLLDRLNEAKRAFVASNDPINAERVFKEACLDAINQTKPVLETHRGWSEVLLDIVNALLSIVTLGIGNAIIGQFRFFEVKTDSAEKLEDLELCVNRMAASAA